MYTYTLIFSAHKAAKNISFLYSTVRARHCMQFFFFFFLSVTRALVKRSLSSPSFYSGLSYPLLLLHPRAQGKKCPLLFKGASLRFVKECAYVCAHACPTPFIGGKKRRDRKTSPLTFRVKSRKKGDGG